MSSWNITECPSAEELGASVAEQLFLENPSFQERMKVRFYVQKKVIEVCIDSLKREDRYGTRFSLTGRASETEQVSISCHTPGNFGTIRLENDGLLRAVQTTE